MSELSEEQIRAVFELFYESCEDGHAYRNKLTGKITRAGSASQ